MTRKTKLRRAHVANPLANPVARAVLAKSIRQDMAAILNAAQIHAWAGSNPPQLINDAGRLVYAVLGAARAAGMTTESADVRIVLGMGEALGDLAADGDIERHRPAIQSGLLALERLLPGMDPMHLIEATFELNLMLESSAGMGTTDLHAMFPPQPRATP